MINGDLAGAESTLVEALTVQRAALGDDNPEIASCRENLANVYFRQGKLDLAEHMSREASARITRTLGPESPDLGVPLMGLGSALRREGKLAEAEPTLQHALAVLTKAYGDSSAMTQGALQDLVALYKDWKKPAQAAVYAARVVPGK
jgi:tetratricopeptide (TPR) repeat protein